MPGKLVNGRLSDKEMSKLCVICKGPMEPDMEVYDICGEHDLSEIKEYWNNPMVTSWWNEHKKEWK